MSLDPYEFLGIRAESVEKNPDEEAIAQARSSAIRWIGLGRKSSGKIMEYLLRQGFTTLVISRVIDDLKGEVKVDDYRLARRQAESRTGAKAESSHRVAQRLSAHGLEDAAIDLALEEHPSDFELAIAAMNGRFDRAQVTGSLTQAQKQKYYRFLMNRGFTCDIARAAIREFLKGLPDQDECEE